MYISIFKIVLILSTRSCSIVLYVCSLLTTTSVHTINLKLYSMYNIFTQYARMPRRMRLFFSFKTAQKRKYTQLLRLSLLRKKSMKTTGEKKRRMKNNRNERKRNGEKEENSEKCKKKSRILYRCLFLFKYDWRWLNGQLTAQKKTHSAQTEKKNETREIIITFWNVRCHQLISEIN